MSEAQGAAAAALAGGNNSAPAPPPAPSGAPAPSAVPSGTPAPAANDSWFAKFEPDIRGVVEKKGWKDAAEPIKSYLELEKQFHGSDKLFVPKDDADPKAWDGVYTRLGRPENPDGYKFPEGVDAAQVKAIAPELFKAGITQKQAEVLAAIDIRRQQAATQALQQRTVADQDAADAKLKSEWGAKYNENMEYARRAMRGTGIDMDTAVQMMGAIGAERALKVLMLAGLSTRESNTMNLGETQLGFGMTPNRAAAELSEKKAALIGRAREGDQVAKAELDRLYKAAYPG